MNKISLPATIYCSNCKMLKFYLKVFKKVYFVSDIFVFKSLIKPDVVYSFLPLKKKDIKPMILIVLNEI